MQGFGIQRSFPSICDLQLELLADDEPGATREEVEAESRREPIPAAPPRKRKPHPGRKPLPENLPRVEEVIACEANCTYWGGETRMIGYDLSEVLDREPAKWFVRVSEHEKRSCGKCSAIQMAPLAPRIVEKGLASDRVIIETVVAKYCDHLPLYRQEAMLEREAGMEISRATLDGWVTRVGELLQPVVDAMREDLLHSSYIQADETIVPVQMHDNREPIIQPTCGNTEHLGRNGVRFSNGPRTRWPKEIPQRLERDFTNRRLPGLRSSGRTGLIHVGLLGARAAKVRRAVKVNPKPRGGDHESFSPEDPAPYGAIAYGDQGAEGMSWNQTSAADADRVALNICGRYGTNCKLVSRFQNMCGALAKSDDERHFEAATGPTKEQAEASAIGVCKSPLGQVFE